MGCEISRKDVEEMIISSGLLCPGWTGRLNEAIVSEYNNGREMESRAYVVRDNLYRTLPDEDALRLDYTNFCDVIELDCGDDYFYTALMSSEESNASVYDFHVKLLSTISRKPCFRHSLEKNSFSIDVCDGGVLFRNEFSIIKTPGPFFVVVEDIGLYSGLRERGLMKCAYRNLTDFFSEHFEGCDITCYIAHPASMKLFREFFENPHTTKEYDMDTVPERTRMVLLHGRVPEPAYKKLPSD